MRQAICVSICKRFQPEFDEALTDVDKTPTLEEMHVYLHRTFSKDAEQLQDQIRKLRENMFETNHQKLQSLFFNDEVNKVNKLKVTSIKKGHGVYVVTVTETNPNTVRPAIAGMLGYVGTGEPWELSYEDKRLTLTPTKCLPRAGGSPPAGGSLLVKTVKTYNVKHRRKSHLDFFAYDPITGILFLSVVDGNREMNGKKLADGNEDEMRVHLKHVHNKRFKPKSGFEFTNVDTVWGMYNFLVQKDIVYNIKYETNQETNLTTASFMVNQNWLQAKLDAAM